VKKTIYRIFVSDILESEIWYFSTARSRGARALTLSGKQEVFTSKSL